MKYLKCIILIVILFSFPLGEVWADSSVAYIGADASSTQTTTYANLLGTTAYKPFAGSDADSNFADPTALYSDAISLTGANGIEVHMLQNNDPSIDLLGYIDFLLSLGIYDTKAMIVNNNTTTSLAMALSAYEANGRSVSEDRITLAKQELTLYQSMEKEIGSVPKTSRIFFNIEKETMEDPDLNIYTDGIILYSLTREKVTISPTLASNLSTWLKTYLSKANSWSGFFREVGLPMQTDSNSMIVVYRALDSAPAENTGVTTNQKIGALIIFIVFLAVIAYFIYKGRQKTLT